MNTRNILIAVAGLAAIGGAAFTFQDDIMNLVSPPSKPAAKAAPAKPQAETPKPAPTPQAEAPKPAPAAPSPSDPAAMDRAIKDAQARVGQLEKEQADLLKQINEKDKQIAAQEKKAGAK